MRCPAVAVAQRQQSGCALGLGTSLEGLAGTYLALASRYLAGNLHGVVEEPFKLSETFHHLCVSDNHLCMYRYTYRYIYMIIYDCI